MAETRTGSGVGTGLRAGAAVADLTPDGPVFLFGYPHVPRLSTGVHDRLECAALYLAGGGGAALFLANDLIFVGRKLAGEVRRRIAAETGVPEEAVMITATHTHSGPVTVDYVSNAADPVVPRADRAYLRFIGERMVAAAVQAVRSAQPAEAGLVVARADGVGSNRHDPAGPADSDVPVLLVRARDEGRPLACMVGYAMHPTVLHEDSTVVSGDFPHFTRAFLQGGALPAGCPVLYHNGASGNQSPRHVAQANTLAEARRLGENLGRAIAAALPGVRYAAELPVAAARQFIDLEPRRFPAPEDADAAEKAARARFESLRAAGAARQAVRTAECDWFGAEETAELARAARDGRLEAALRKCVPAEVQVISVGPWHFAGWPGEFFVEYALELRRRCPECFVFTMANGELQGYIVTPEAAARGVYEATNAVFGPENGSRFVETTLALLGRRP